jgi:hypothetical protein
MFIRFRQMTAKRYGGGERQCAGKCKDRPRYHARYGVGSYVQGGTFLEGCPMRPICPLVEPRERLDVSLVETRRDGGKVKQEHIASLGSCPLPASMSDREAFWAQCEVRLAGLGNRIGPDMERLHKVLEARIPPLTDDDRAAMDAAAWDQLEAGWDDYAKRQIDNAVSLERFAEKYRSDAALAEDLKAHTKERGNPEVFDALHRAYLAAILAAAKAG